MKVRMRALAAGPQGVLYAGQVYDLPAEQAQALVDGGYAETVGRAETRPVKVAPETAAIQPAEAAVKPPAKKRRQKEQ